MTPHDYGETNEYVVTWRNGGVDHINAHQVSWPSSSNPLAAFLMGADRPQESRRVQFHAEVDGRWRLLLDALEDDIISIRNVTQLPETIE